MIDAKMHVGELHWGLFPYYALTNWVAALRAYQLGEINFIIRMWMVIGLVGGAHGHLMDFIQVLKGDRRGYFDSIQATKTQHFMGMLLLGFPSLLGIYAIVYLYIINVSVWSIESFLLILLVCLTLGYDLYFTMGWGTSFFWHKNHVLAHCVFLISEYTATGYLAYRSIASFSFFGIQAVVAICLEVLLFFPHLVFKIPQKITESRKLNNKNDDQFNMQAGAIAFMCIFGLAFGIDYLIKCNNPYTYIPGASG